MNLIVEYRRPSTDSKVALFIPDDEELTNEEHCPGEGWKINEITSDHEPEKES